MTSLRCGCSLVPIPLALWQSATLLPALLDSINTTATKHVKTKSGMTTRTTIVCATISVPLRTTEEMAIFAKEAGLESFPSTLNLVLASSSATFAEDQIAFMRGQRHTEPQRPVRRNRVKPQLGEDEEAHRQSAQQLQDDVDVADALFQLLDVNSEDLREATFTMQEMLELTLLHTRQLQALQQQHEATVKELQQQDRGNAVSTSTFGIQTDPLPDPQPEAKPEVVTVEVEKLVEVEKVIEKIVERVKVVEKIVEVPVQVPVYRDRSPRPGQTTAPPRFIFANMNNPFLQRLVMYARHSLERRKELKETVEDERDRVLTAQMASRFILDNEDTLSRPEIGDEDVCLPAMFMPGGDGFSSKFGGAWYPMNSIGRRTQPPSMVSLPPVRLPPLSASSARDNTNSPSQESNPFTPSPSRANNPDSVMGDGTRLSTANAWRRMRLNNTRATSGILRRSSVRSDAQEEPEFPWPGRPSSARDV
eukprot:m.169888 g.169888  ORF g.169888 m.169888 type:complete len:478 (+) comp16481_c0_seq3:1238-2671(+)